MRPSLAPSLARSPAPSPAPSLAQAPVDPVAVDLPCGHPPRRASRKRASGFGPAAKAGAASPRRRRGRFRGCGECVAAEEKSVAAASSLKRRRFSGCVLQVLPQRAGNRDRYQGCTRGRCRISAIEREALSGVRQRALPHLVQRPRGAVRAAAKGVIASRAGIGGEGPGKTGRGRGACNAPSRGRRTRREGAAARAASAARAAMSSGPGGVFGPARRAGGGRLGLRHGPE